MRRRVHPQLPPWGAVGRVCPICRAKHQNWCFRRNAGHTRPTTPPSGLRYRGFRRRENRTGAVVKAQTFFARHPFFRRDELVAAYEAVGSSATSAKRALDYDAKTGVLLNVRQGVYMVNGPAFDAWLLPAKLHPEAVLAYDGAALMHGLAELDHSVSDLAPRYVRPLWLGEVAFRSVVEPETGDVVSRMGFVKNLVRDGHEVAVTTLERTIVDCFDDLDRAPPLEGLFDSLLARATLDVEAVAREALQRAGPAGCARVGLLLASRPERSEVRGQLAELERRSPRETTYATRDRAPGGYYARRWHLQVPRAMSMQLRMAD
ncbi:MAG: hypothetical protein JNK82_20525 [Myxococcaceae bacterium]|nr:hypothetical protein [Myxococcaceae bacterium]